MSSEQHAPPRLRQTLGPAGDCVRQVLAEQEAVPPLPRFAQLQERRVRRVRRQRGLSLIVLAAVAFVAARALHQEEPRASIRAELPASPNNRVPVVSSALARDEALAAREPPAPAPAKLEGPPAVAPKSSRPSAEVPARPDELDHAQADAAAQPDNAGEDRGTAKACAQLARDGAAEQALVCYQKLSNAKGMTAEVALFEQARLEGKVLRRPERALSTLGEYRRRFPNGSLRGEVMLAQIDWLQAAGDPARALEVVDEALASGLLHERTAELSRLRARLSAAHDQNP